MHNKAYFDAHQFIGFKRIGWLKKHVQSIPAIKGVYVVCCGSKNAPKYLEESRGGSFKGRNPTVELSKLRQKWVPGAYVLYVGQASRQTLRSRIKQYLDFGAGKPVGHWGGRFIWQLKGQDQLLVAWKSMTRGNPKKLERTLINNFISHYGQKPFANIV